jgi:hypothetical protein
MTLTICDPDATSVPQPALDLGFDLDLPVDGSGKSRYFLGNSETLGSLIGHDLSNCPSAYEAFAHRLVDKTRPFFREMRHKNWSKQVALLVLRLSGSQRINYLARTIPPCRSIKAVKIFDNLLRNTFTAICDFQGSQFTTEALLQTTLPFRAGGLGLRPSARSLHMAYIGSFALVAGDLDRILPAGPARLSLPSRILAEASRSALSITMGAVPSSFFPDPADDMLDFYAEPVTSDVLTAARALFGAGVGPKAKDAPTRGSALKVQKALTFFHENILHDTLWTQLDADAKKGDIVAQRSLARMRSCAGPGAAASLSLTPVSEDLEMDDFEFEIELRLRLGLPPVNNMPDTCTCGYDFTLPLADPWHFFFCLLAKGGVIKLAHDMIVTVLCICAREANYAVLREPEPELHNATDMIKVDYVKTTEIDVTGKYPCSPSYLLGSFKTSLYTAAVGEKAKIVIHGAKCAKRGHLFEPFAFERFGALGECAQRVCKDMTKMAMSHAGVNVKAGPWFIGLVERIAVARVRGNAKIISRCLRDARYNIDKKRLELSRSVVGIPSPAKSVAPPRYRRRRGGSLWGS